jgi:S-DNA-T family DNA segregation ATPase FtsK/SpoIIIE
MISVADVVGSVVADIARTALDASNDSRRPALRISGFSQPEVVQVLKALAALSVTDGDRGIVVKVGTSRPILGVDDKYLLRPDETLTQWRNADVPALLLLDWDVQADEEGLAALNRLDDLSVLPAQDGELAQARFETLIAHSWTLAGGREVPPGRLVADLTAVRTAVATSNPLSLRRWTAFVLRTCEDLQLEVLLTPEAVDRCVGVHLSELELFPDTSLFVHESAVRSRLGRNVRVSDFRQPGGGPITEDDLLLRIDSVVIDEDLLARFEVSLDDARTKMRELVQGGGAAARAEIDLALWLELFERRTPRAGLGQLARESVEAVDPDRLPEYENLDVEAGLDHSEQEAAERLLRAEPPQGSRPLIDTLPARLRRRVEKLAFPDAQVEADPLRALLHALSVLEDMAGDEVTLGMEGSVDDGEWSKWLFALLYAPTLQEIADRVSESRRTLVIDDRLVDLRRPELPDQEEEFDPARAWAALRLVVTTSDAGRRRFRWDPLANSGLLAFGALLFVDEPEPGLTVDTDLDGFCDRFVDPRSWNWLGMAAHPPGTLPAAMSDARTEFLTRLRVGVSPGVLEEYLESWSQFAERARVTLVPTNAPDPSLAAVVLSDVIELSDGHLAMLATHPLRLRWVARHLRRMSDLLVHSLSTGLTLNGENSELFFEWLERASPHGTPPFVVGSDETVAISVRELGWHEEYAPIRQLGVDRRDWLVAVDDAAIDELVGVLASYVDTYPYKRDGLVLLLLDRDGTARLPLRIAQRLRARVSGLQIELHVLAPRPSHHEIVRAFEDAFTDDDARQDRLFPEVQLVLRHWDPDLEPDLDELIDRVDVALAPALFGTRTTLNRQTRDPSAGLSGAYDPWLHPSTHDLTESSQNVVRVMLPSQLDPILETWSTLCVRHDAHSAVAPQQESNTDYFALQVRFDRHQRLFAQLHRVAHWVVTLDAFVGRDQVDALEDRPDVILVRTGVGKNEAYTLIVSSGTGRRFVVQRLARKLEYDLGFPTEPPIADVANRFYDVGRNVVPGAVLRALGLGRAANEVVGLVASRFEVARQIPARSERSGLVVWISFDEQQSWFGRTQRTRADLGRFVLTVDDELDAIRLDVLVIESKFRQNYDPGQAEQQLDRTTDLCLAAFRNEDPLPDDSEFWRLELAAAIEQTSRAAALRSELPARMVIGPPRESLEDVVLQSLRSGNVVLDGVAGVAVAIASQAGEPAPPMSSLGRHTLLRINRPELLEIVAKLVGNEAPEPPPARPEAEGGPAPDEGAPRTERVLSAQQEGSQLAEVAERSDRPSETEGGAGLGEHELRSRYERLLDVLSEHRVSVVRPPGDAWLEGPGFYVLRVVPRSGVTVDRVVNRVDEIALALRLEPGAKIRSSLDRGTIVFEVPKSSDERYPVDARELWSRCPVQLGRLEVPIGEDISGHPIQLEFSSPDSPHLLVAGTTGSGKSVALETILRGLCRYPDQLVRLRLVDPKGTELLDFVDDSHTDGDIGMDAADTLTILEAAVAEMESRYRLMRPQRARSLADYNASVPEPDRLPWIVIVLDEYADLTSDAEDKSRIEAQLRRLTQKARAAGIHVIAATQRPSADVVSTTIRSNFPAQLALRVKTATDSRIIMDEPGAETLAGQGDAFLRTARGITRLQVAWAG